MRYTHLILVDDPVKRKVKTLLDPSQCREMTLKEKVAGRGEGDWRENALALKLH